MWQAWGRNGHPHRVCAAQAGRAVPRRHRRRNAGDRARLQAERRQGVARPPPPKATRVLPPVDPLRYDASRRADYERHAALGLSHVIYAKTPGGVIASAQRTERFRSIYARVGRRHGLDPDTLAAIAMLESAGRPDAQASSDLSSAVGLTQILAETGQNLLGLHIDVKQSERLTRGIDRGSRVATRTRKRMRIDERFDPAMAVEATARYLDFAKSQARRPHRSGRRELPHGRRQPAAGARALRQGRRALRAAVLRLQPGAQLRGLAQARLARRRLLDLLLARAGRQGDPAPVPQRPQGAERPRGAAVPQGLLGGGAAPRGDHPALRRRRRDRRRAGLGRAHRAARGHAGAGGHPRRPRDGRAGREDRQQAQPLPRAAPAGARRPRGARPRRAAHLRASVAR